MSDFITSLLKFDKDKFLNRKVEILKPIIVIEVDGNYIKEYPYTTSKKKREKIYNDYIKCINDYIDEEEYEFCCLNIVQPNGDVEWIHSVDLIEHREKLEKMKEIYTKLN